MKAITVLLSLSALALAGLIAPPCANAQVRERIEPPELPMQAARTPHQEGLRTGWMARFALSDNGLALGTEVRKVLAPYTELMLSLEAGGIRDSREQVFNSYFGQITPNKYNRVASMPLMIGFRQRLFSGAFDDGFRMNIAGQVGPTAAFVYPYFKDNDGNGIRDSQPTNFDEYYDVFRGWKEGDFMFGSAGRFTVGIDFGERFRRVTSFEFGYQFQYFADGIQIMQPHKYEVMQTPEGLFLNIVPGASKQSFFGTPVISVSFGRFW